RTVSGEIFQFEIDDFRKRCLLEGLDEIGLTLGKAETIKGYEQRRMAAHPWVFGAIK
ncbi:3-isopropylmalate dehydratase small subunit, partial [Porticoccaceae bacterium]|nr:3-isopropylmalate dehydratase small subunit [Porticoccaceae bacterium]